MKSEITIHFSLCRIFKIGLLQWTIHFAQVATGLVVPLDLSLHAG
jgi:hypothetical protein